MSFRIVRTDNRNPDFTKLIVLLEEDLSERCGEIHKQYKQFNKIDFIKDVILIYDEELPIGCGGIKQYSNEAVELKRVFVHRDYRGQGVAKLLIKCLEDIARELNYNEMILETGVNMLPAISLYKKLGFSKIQNYVPYEGNANSICMKKSV